MVPVKTIGTTVTTTRGIISVLETVPAPAPAREATEEVVRMSTVPTIVVTTGRVRITQTMTIETMTPTATQDAVSVLEALIVPLVKLESTPGLTVLITQGTREPITTMPTPLKRQRQ